MVRTNLKRGDQAEALALQPDGKLVAAGRAHKPDEDSQGPYESSLIAIARYEGR
jgi:hypothetical protein